VANPNSTYCVLYDQRFNSAAVPHMASPFLIHAGLQISTAALAALGLIQSAVGCHLISASDVLQNMPPLLTTGGGNSDNPAYSGGQVGGNQRSTGGSESVSTLNEVASECQTQTRSTVSQPLNFCLRLDSLALGDGHINSNSDFLSPLPARTHRCLSQQAHQTEMEMSPPGSTAGGLIGEAGWSHWASQRREPDGKPLSCTAPSISAVNQHLHCRSH
jgi:hypothetical protein